MNTRHKLFVVVWSELTVATALANEYPVRSIRLIVPFAPGGGNDIMGRFIARKMSERMGQQTIVDNRAGADGIIGTEIAARSAPDGYTILIISTSYTQNAAIHNLP
jgi:tripartite-type tricarboxylate transporter receptor subunit TctC